MRSVTRRLAERKEAQGARSEEGGEGEAGRGAERKERARRGGNGIREFPEFFRSFFSSHDAGLKNIRNFFPASVSLFFRESRAFIFLVFCSIYWIYSFYCLKNTMKSSGKRLPESGRNIGAETFPACRTGSKKGESVCLRGLPTSRTARPSGRAEGGSGVVRSCGGKKAERGRERRGGESVRGCAEEAGGAAQRCGRKWKDTEGREGIGATGNSPACAAGSGGVAAFVGRSL